MALVTTPGAVDANSYVDIAYADAFFASQVVQGVWPTTLASKEAALIDSTRLLDSQFDWVGYIASEEQSLRWPRTDAYDADDRLLPSDGIPNIVKQATCYLAMFLIQNGGLTQFASNVAGVKVGPIDLKFTDKSVVGLPSFVIRLLSGYGSYTGPSQGAAHSVSAVRS